MESIVGFIGFNVCMFLALFATGRLKCPRSKFWFRGLSLVASSAFLIGLLIPPVSAAMIAEYWHSTGPARPWEVACDVSANRAFYTAQMSNRIGLVEWGAGKFTEWTIPTPGSNPWGIALGPEIYTDTGTFVWFTESVGSKIGRLNPVTGEFVEWRTTTPAAEPRDIAIDRPRLTVWFTEFMVNQIGKLTYVGGVGWQMTEYPIPSAIRGPHHLAVDSDGIVWFTAIGSYHVARFNPWKGEFTGYLVPSSPNGVTFDQDGFVWFTSIGTNMICRLNWWRNETVGWVVPTGGSSPSQIVVDQDRNVWFTEFATSKIGKFVPGTANFHEYPTPTPGGQPYGICIHSSDTIVFTEAQTNRLGRVFQPAWMAGGVDTKTTTVDWISHASPTSTAAATVSARTTISPTSPSIATAYTTSTATAWSITSSTITETKSILYTSSTTTSTQTSTSTTITTTTTTTTTSQASTTTETSTTTTTTSTTTTSTTTETSSSTTTVTYPTTTFSPTITSMVVTSWTSTSSSFSTTTTYTTGTSTSTSITTYLTTVTVTPTVRRCLIASAAYGSELEPEVQFLRGFRDQSVEATFAGSSFMRIFNAFYYSFSPAVASSVTQYQILREAVKVLLYPLVVVLRSASTVFGVFSSTSEFAIAASGVAASALIGVVYVTPLATIASLCSRRLGRRREEN